MKNRRQTLIRFLIPFGLSTVLLSLLIYQVDGTAILASLKKSRLHLLVLAVIISLLINIFAGALKWRRILSALGCRLPFYEVLSIRTGCIPFKIVFPMKSSELLKAVYLSRRGHLSFTRSVSSLALDKILNLFVVICVALIGLMLTDTPLPRLIPVLLFLLMAPLLFSKQLPGFLVRLVKRIHPGLAGVTDNLASAFQTISFSEKLILLAWSVLYQASEFLNTFILLKAAGVAIPPATLMMTVPLIMIITNLPITILGLGTREAAIIFFFAAHGPPAALLSGSILISLVEHVLPVLAGLLFMRSFYRLFSLKKELTRTE